MIKRYQINQPPVTIKSDLAGEFPIYLYFPNDKSTLLYSQSITQLLNDKRIPKPLKICNKGISFLLQSGVIPPPKTAYQDIYIIGIGDKVEFKTLNNKIDITFSYQFPFMNSNRLKADEMQPDEDFILQMLAESVISRVDKSKPSFLFHSAGKDSNSIALALAEAGWQDKVTLITHKSKGKADESELSAKIAKQLGFKHQILHEVDQLQAEHHQAIENYFLNAPFPCIDNVTLAYPLYAHQLPELKGANIIDGAGNDAYMGYAPGLQEFKKQKISIFSNFLYLNSLANQMNSESFFRPILRSRIEWTGLVGLSNKDAKNIQKTYSPSVNNYWETKNKEYTKLDYIDLRSLVRGTIIETGIFQLKARNFAYSMGANLVTPWMNQQIAEYFAKMPETYLFDRQQFKNKLILRKILQKRIGLDSNALGKMGFSYDSRSIVLQNWNTITQEMYACALWEQSALVAVINRLKSTMQSKHKYAELSGRLIYRIYLVSSWANKNRYINE